MNNKNIFREPYLVWILVALLFACSLLNCSLFDTGRTQLVATFTPTQTASATLSLPPTSTPTPTVSATKTPTSTSVPTDTPAPTPTPTETATPTPEPTASATATTTPKPLTCNGKPIQYETIFRTVAAKYGLNWRVMAIQGCFESRFDSEAIGGINELGVMQIAPGTWDYLATRIDIDSPDPLNPRHNIEAAGFLLAELREGCKGWGDDSDGCPVLAYAIGQGAAGRFYDGGGGSWVNHYFSWYIHRLFEEIKNYE